MLKKNVPNISFLIYSRSELLSLRESLLFDFGAVLMSKETLWVFGIDYLEQCSIEGSGAIEIFLSKMNIKSEKNAMKILNVLRSKGLVEVGMYV